MLVNTKCFGTVNLDEDKVITLVNGLAGFEDYKRYTILFDCEDDHPVISWFQSLDEPELAFPVINPFLILDAYDPKIDEEYLKPLGDLKDENIVVLLVLTVPEDLTKMTVNLRAPIIINSETRKGSQIIVENQDYSIRYNVYEALQKHKKEGE